MIEITLDAWLLHAAVFALAVSILFYKLTRTSPRSGGGPLVFIGEGFRALYLGFCFMAYLVVHMIVVLFTYL